MLGNGTTAVTWESVAITIMLPTIGVLGGSLWWSLNKKIDQLEEDQDMQNDRLARLEIRSEGHTAGIQRLENKLDQTASKIDKLSVAIYDTSRIEAAVINAIRAANEK